MEVVDIANRSQNVVDTEDAQLLPNPDLAWEQVTLKPKSQKALRELSRCVREGRAVSALWSSESRHSAVQIACLLARDVGCRVIHVRLRQSPLSSTSSYSNELAVQLDRLFALTEKQGSILVLDDMDALLCSRDDLIRQRFESYLLTRLAQHRGTTIVVTPQHKRINPRLVRRLHFALAV